MADIRSLNDLPVWNPDEDEEQQETQTATPEPQDLTIEESGVQNLEELPEWDGTITEIDITANQEEQPFSTRFEETEDGSTAETFLQDEDFLIAARNVYKFNNNQEDFEGSDEELIDYALDTMGWFNYNLPKMTVDTAIITRADETSKASFLYLMEAYDDLNMSWDGVWRFVKGTGTDPTTWAGLASFGLATAASQAGKQATKIGVKELLKGGLRNTAIAATEGAIYSYADNINRQEIETSVTGEDIDYGEAAKASLYGGAIAGTMGFALTPGINFIQRKVGANKPTPKTKATAKDAEKTITPEDLVKANDDLLNKAKAEGTSTPASATVTALDRIQSALKTITAKGYAGVNKEGVQNRKAVKEATEILTQIVADVVPTDTDSVIVAMGKLFNQITPAEKNALGVSIQNNVGQLKQKIRDINKTLDGEMDDVTRQSLIEQADEIEELTVKLETLDSMFRTDNARGFGLRQDYLNTGKLLDVTPASIKRDKNVTDEEARRIFNELVDKQENALRRDNEIKNITGQINTAIKRGSTGKAFELIKKRRQMLQDKAYENANSKAYYRFNRLVEGVNEYVIGTVFTTSTLVFNTVPSLAKTIYKPFINFAVEGEYGRVGFGKLFATYNAMGKVTGGALRAALTAYRYERSMLTGDYSKFIENHNVLPKKIKDKIPVGSFIRFFPNALNFTDEFFAQVTYRGYIEGQTVANALVDNQKRVKPLKGEALKKYIQKKVDEQVTNAYEAIDEVEVKQTLLEQALSRGMNAKQARAFVKDELKKNRDLFKTSKNKEGRDYTEDLLFKRRFSEEGNISKGAAQYEQIVKNNPLMRIMGQLFFRTPVRVFEEGIRLTPGFQLIAPRYIDDLRGKNGTARQVRAQGEALMSYAIAGWVMTQYSQGKITGSANSDYRKRKAREDGDRAEPYSITLDDGDTFNFNRFDPLSTPLKILVNAMESYEMLEYRRRQGEYVDNDFKFATDSAYVALGSLFNAIKDASLMEGLDQVINLGTDVLSNEDTYLQNIIKFLGQKTQLAMPNMIYKVKNAFLEDEPTLKNPKTYLQYLESRAGLGLVPVADQYDPLGNPRPIKNPMSALTGVTLTSKEQRGGGKSERDLFVLRELELMGIATDSYITIPSKLPKYFGQIDMAKEYVVVKRRDGSTETMTMYDRYVELYRNAGGGLVNKLYPILANRNNRGFGTANTDGYITSEVRKIIKEQREIAALALMRDPTVEYTEEVNWLEQFRDRQVRTGKNKAGLNDDNIFPNVRD